MNDYEKIVLKRIFLWVLKRSWLAVIWGWVACSFYYSPQHHENLATFLMANLLGIVSAALTAFILYGAVVAYKALREIIKYHWALAVKKVEQEYRGKFEEL